MQSTSQWLLRLLIVSKAYLANEEPPMSDSTQERKTYQYDWKVAAIHKLRVNVKSLAAEAKIIRKEAMRASAMYGNELNLHRRGRLREEARYSQLALCFLRGRKYRQVEHANSKPVDSLRLAKKLSGFTGKPTGPELTEWLG